MISVRLLPILAALFITGALVIPSLAEETRVPMKDARKASIDGIRTFASGVSANKNFVLVIYGRNDELLKITVEVAREAIESGKKVRGVVIGPTDVAAGVEIFANGQRMNKDGLLTTAKEIANWVCLSELIMKKNYKLTRDDIAFCINE